MHRVDYRVIDIITYQIFVQMEPWQHNLQLPVINDSILGEIEGRAQLTA